VAKVVKGSYHSFFQHHHLTFDQGAGQAEFRQRINRIFSRNGIAFEFRNNGQITRLGPEVLRESLQTVTFKTGDPELDSLLETARSKFLSPDPKLRRESLEKLWDAWERLKTLEPGKDKKASVKSLLDKATGEPKFRDLLEREARELTDIGNTFQIRHTETTQRRSTHLRPSFTRLLPRHTRNGTAGERNRGRTAQSLWPARTRPASTRFHPLDRPLPTRTEKGPPLPQMVP
jgi:hypothetical protein